MRTLFLTAAVASGMLGAAPVAPAATLDYDPARDAYVFFAEEGERNSVGVWDKDAATVAFSNGAAPDLTGRALEKGCAQPDGMHATCPRAATRVVVDLGDLPDRLIATSSLPTRAAGGDGDDSLTVTGPGGDTVEGGPGNDEVFVGKGADTVDAGAGDDRVQVGSQPEPGPDGAADVLKGGDGLDTIVYVAYVPLRIALDDAADDGPAGEADNIASDFEDIVQRYRNVANEEAAASGVGDRYAGTAAGNVIVAGDGGDEIDPRGGSDVVDARQGDDRVDSRDGWVDRVACGEGTDTADVDQLDIVSDTCETIDVTRVANANDSPEDGPPSMAWIAPATGATLSTTQANQLAVTAADDRGIAQVVFLAGETIVCTDTAAPFECAYAPSDLDVGRTTLSAVAVDTAQQSVSIVRSVAVPRFAPAGLSAQTTPKRDRRAPYAFTTAGRLALPAAVAPARGCTGTVAVQFKAGRKTVSTRRVELAKDCSYRSKVAFRLPGRLRPEKLRVFVSHRGNAVMLPGSATLHTVRVR